MGRRKQKQVIPPQATVGFLTLFVLAGARAALADQSWTFVGSDANQAILLQLIETGDHSLVGHYEEIELRGDKTSTFNASVSGAITGRAVVLTLKPAEILSPTISMSGTMRGAAISLTGGAGEAALGINLVQGDLQTFQMDAAHLNMLAQEQAHLEAVNARGKQLEAQDQDYLNTLGHLNQMMAGIGAALQVRERQLAAIERQYRAITERMAAVFKREQALVGHGQIPATAAQIPFMENRYSMQADELHMAVTTHLQSVKVWVKQTFATIRTWQSRCAGARSQSSRLSTSIAVERERVQAAANDPAARRDHKRALQQNIKLFDDVVQNFSSLMAACQTFEQELPNFDAGIQEDLNAYQNTEAVWQAEHQRQKEIVAASEAAAN